MQFRGAPMSKAFKEIKSLDLPALEAEILATWTRENTFTESVVLRAGAPSFTFYEGPPTANGRPGIHHVLGRTIKDVFCRYKTLKGFQVERKAGWDTHGLPVEIEVEKELGLEGREQVEAYGIEAFNAACKASVLRYKKDWDELTRLIGYWTDLDQPYVTYETPYIESVWWLIKQIYERGLLYKGHKIQWYSPGTGTVLSSHEVSLGYREVSDPSVYVRFRASDDPGLSFLAWTTTPWTLISNVALVVGEDIEYVTVDTGDERLLLAAARLDILDGEYTVIERHRGRDLLGRRYEPLFRCRRRLITRRQLADPRRRLRHGRRRHRPGPHRAGIRRRGSTRSASAKSCRWLIRSPPTVISMPVHRWWPGRGSRTPTKPSSAI